MRPVIKILVASALLASANLNAATSSNQPVDSGWRTPVVSNIAPGVWRVRFGEPERFTPNSAREKPTDLDGIARLPAPAALPFKLEDIGARVTTSRTVVHVPCDEPNDQIYGFGLDPAAYEQKGLRKYLTVCAGVMGKTGASHGPVPFWLSTRGYGVFVDTARVTFVHVARLTPLASDVAESDSGPAKSSVAELYAARKATGKSEVVVEIPGDNSGVDVYIFAGPPRCAPPCSATTCSLEAAACRRCGDWG